jgi:hypothetical protein
MMDNINMENVNNQKEDNKNTYFALKDAEDCAIILIKRGESFYQHLRANSYLDKLSRMWAAYHGAYVNDVGYGHNITFTGEQGEITTLTVNHFRNIASHIYNMVTSSRPAMQTRAINNDYKSLSQTYLADGILDYYMREKGLEESIKRATEMAIVLGAGFIRMEWNATAGEAYDIDPETGEINYEGEIEFSVHSPFDIVVDGTKEEWKHEWIMVRSFQNRHNLIAKYPEKKDRILGIPTKSEHYAHRLSLFTNDESDDIAVFEFYHKRSEAVPEGRYLLFLSDGTVLLDTKLPYREIPIYRIAPANILGTPYGYSPMFDIYPIQEAINALYSIILTNQNTFGIQNVFVPKGADISIASLQGGMNIIEGNEKPEPINLTQTPAEVFKFIQDLIREAETISGVNSVARGNPEASLRSGNALALVQSMALQFISGLQQSYIKLIEDCGTALINILKDFSTSPKLVALVGRHNRSYLKEFTGDMIKDINRVVVDVGNPLAKTIAGRVQMAEQMLQMNIIKNPQQYFQVINTGRLDAMYDGDMSELLLIKSENERLMDGEDVIASLLDAHRMHIIEHKSVLADPELRKDPTLVQKTLKHIQEHIDFLRTADPNLLQLIGEQPLAPMPQPGQPPIPPEMGGNEGMGVPMSENPMMSIPSGVIQSGENILSPENPQSENQKMPNLPKVPPELLPNPQIQEQIMGNLKQ